MQLSVSGKQLTVTPMLYNHVSARMKKIARHFDHVINTQVVLRVEKTRHFAEATITTKGATLHASAGADDMYAAIDAMAVKLDRQVIRHKEKLGGRRAPTKKHSAQPGRKQ